MQNELTGITGMANVLGSVYDQADYLVMVAVGNVNNAAWAACLDAIDQTRRHPRYRQQVSGGTTPGREFRQCFTMLKEYERKLIHPVQGDKPRLFHVADMLPDVRKAYGSDFTDHDYFDYWVSFGFTTYQHLKPFFTSLVNKVRLAYLHQGIACSDIMGWASAALLALNAAGEIWQDVTGRCADADPSVPRSRWERRYADFNLRPVAVAWKRAVDDLDPKARFNPTGLDHDNIQAGYEQIVEKWLDIESIYGSRIKTAEDYADIFRTHGEMKKAMRQFAEARAAAEETMK